jgi:hypothetical protein
VSLALTRAIRFAPGAVLRLTPSINGKLLEALQSARPQVGELLAAAQAARLTIESLDENGCRMRAAQFEVELSAADAEVYRLRLAWSGSADGAQRSLQVDGIAPMLSGRSDVYFAQRSGSESRFWLKLSYSTEGAALHTFPPSFAEQVPSALRALLPSQLALGTLNAA